MGYASSIDCIASTKNCADLYEASDHEVQYDLYYTFSYNTGSQLKSILYGEFFSYNRTLGLSESR